MARFSRASVQIHCYQFNSPERRISGKKKAHKHTLFGRVALGTTPGLSQGQTQVFSLFYTMEAQFVPGTNLVCPRDNPRRRRAAEKVYVLTVYVPFSLARITNCITFTFANFIPQELKSAPAEGQQQQQQQQQQQLKTTSNVTSKFPWCCRASVS